jgi:cytochrome c-type biogenesis protein CcmH/NrfG
MNKGDFEGAISALRKAIELKPRFKDAMFNLADALYSAGMPDESREILRKLFK